MNDYHKSVLLKEVVEGLSIKKGGLYIDCTLGAAGHTQEIIKKGGKVLGLDVDEDATEYVKKNYLHLIENGKLKVIKANFKQIDKVAKENGYEKVDGILFDLGVSSHQLDTAERGFSFSKNAQLDMRMDRDLLVTAADLINGLNKGELYELFSKLGEESFARTISNNIIRARGIKRIETTGELSEIVFRSYPRGVKKINPATKVFQALRIAVNDELNNLKDALSKALSLLKHKGRMCIITFHSLEDRIVKNEFENFEGSKLGVILTKKPITPDSFELAENTRSRSAKLRIFEKI